MRRPRTRLRHPLREKGSKLGAPSCCRLSPSKEDDDGRPSPSNDNLWPVCRSSIDVFISPEAMVLLVARHIWHEAQERELGWWSGFQDKLTSVDFVERKRLEILQIWANVRRFVDTSVPRVLEIGAGGHAFVNFIPEAYCVGLEPLIFEMKRNGIGVFLPSARFVTGVGEHLPFRDNEFDVVFSYNVLDHTSDPRSGLDEIIRVLRRGGILHLYVDTYSLAFKLYRAFYRSDRMHPHTFTAHEIHRWLSRRGLRVVRDVSNERRVGRRRHRVVQVFCSRER